MKFTPTTRAAFYAIAAMACLVAFLVFSAINPEAAALAFAGFLIIIAAIACFLALRERFIDNDEREKRIEERAERLANDLAELRASMPPPMAPIVFDTCKCGPNASVCHSGVCSKCGLQGTD